MSVLRTSMSAALAGALCFGCGGGVDGAASPAKASTTADSPSAGSVPVQMPVPPASGVPVTSELQRIIDAARADAAARTGVPLSQLVVTSAEVVIWSDGSIGCPMPGIAYTMALVPGHRILIRAGETTLDYHAGGGQLILCPASRAIDPLPLQRG